MVYAIICLAIITFVSTVILIRVTKHLSNMMNVIYFLSNRQKHCYDRLNHIEEMLTAILSTSLDNKQKTHYPDKNEILNIEATIKDQINIETSLSDNMKVPKRDSIYKIIENVVRTYPHIDEEYLIKKCLGLLEVILNKS